MTWRPISFQPDQEHPHINGGYIRPSRFWLELEPDNTQEPLTWRVAMRKTLPADTAPLGGCDGG